ncbi:ATP-binding protein [Pseudomonadota bacterium]
MWSGDNGMETSSLQSAGSAVLMTPVLANTSSLEREIAWFSHVLDTRIALYFEQPCDYDDVHEIEPPDLTEDESEFARIVKELNMGFDERMVFMLAMVPHVRPQILDTLFIRNNNLDRGYTEFGGWKGVNHSGFLPTCETAVFIIAGKNLAQRFQVQQLFEEEHDFTRKNILRIERHNMNEPFFCSALVLSTEYLNRCTSAVYHKPDFSMNFPAKRITTPLCWNDLVLAPQVMAEIENIRTWMKHASTIMKEWGLEKSVKPGYRSLFYGPPGTGKTLTATLIGADVGVDVYRIDLSMVVSKYIGETEKNLANVFDQAENKNWILFFDEADALFGKRTQASSSNDRHANQEISYLLQRIEDFPGVVILATNLKANIDDAFARRFQSLVYFPAPDEEQRFELWKNTLNGKARLEEGVDLNDLAKSYELTGGAITNVVRFGAINALQRQHDKICHDDLVSGVIKELRKEGKTV